MNLLVYLSPFIHPIPKLPKTVRFQFRIGFAYVDATGINTLNAHYFPVHWYSYGVPCDAGLSHVSSCTRASNIVSADGRVVRYSSQTGRLGCPRHFAAAAAASGVPVEAPGLRAQTQIDLRRPLRAQIPKSSAAN
ncbi:hypothetical protein QE152_g38396 [Popillia japonica]|uniref:Uncharacterized protein n=1 Tax=Popillia japonica TaxID=7064 RepID=A0AAW1HXD9_POPJA